MTKLTETSSTSIRQQSGYGTGRRLHTNSTVINFNNSQISTFQSNNQGVVQDKTLRPIDIRHFHIATQRTEEKCNITSSTLKISTKDQYNGPRKQHYKHSSQKRLAEKNTTHSYSTGQTDQASHYSRIGQYERMK